MIDEKAKNDTRKRLKEVLTYYSVSENSLADGDSATQKRLNRQLRGAVITLGTLLLVLDRFPDVSAEWLMRGTGSMLNAPVDNHSHHISGGINGNVNSNIGDAQTLEGMVQIIQDMQKQIRDKDARINTLTDKLLDK